MEISDLAIARGQVLLPSPALTVFLVYLFSDIPFGQSFTDFLPSFIYLNTKSRSGLLVRPILSSVCTTIWQCNCMTVWKGFQRLLHVHVCLYFFLYFHLFLYFVVEKSGINPKNNARTHCFQFLILTVWNSSTQSGHSVHVHCKILIKYQHLMYMYIVHVTSECRLLKCNEWDILSHVSKDFRSFSSTWYDSSSHWNYVKYMRIWYFLSLLRCFSA